MNKDEVNYRKHDLIIGVFSITYLCLATLLIFTCVFGTVLNGNRATISDCSEFVTNTMEK